MKRIPRPLITIAVIVATLALIMASIQLVQDDTFSLLDGSVNSPWTYFVIFFFVAADAVIPIFPGETTLNTASTLASHGELELIWVTVAGALGAIIGDNALYWLARAAGSGSMARKAEELEHDARVARVLDILGKRAAMLIVFGRYVPGVRFLVNASMGLTRMPYGSFLRWSILGGTLWAVYTCLLAYAVGAALDDYPIMSILISGLITTALIGGIYWVDVRSRRAA